MTSYTELFKGYSKVVSVMWKTIQQKLVHKFISESNKQRDMNYHPIKLILFINL